MYNSRVRGYHPPPRVVHAGGQEVTVIVVEYVRCRHPHRTRSRRRWQYMEPARCVSPRTTVLRGRTYQRRDIVAHFMHDIKYSRYVDATPP